MIALFLIDSLSWRCRDETTKLQAKIPLTVRTLCNLQNPSDVPEPSTEEEPSDDSYGTESLPQQNQVLPEPSSDDECSDHHAVCPEECTPNDECIDGGFWDETVIVLKKVAFFPSNGQKMIQRRGRTCIDVVDTGTDIKVMQTKSCQQQCVQFALFHRRIWNDERML